MNESTLMDYLNKCQHLQRESKNCDMDIDYSHKYHGFVVGISDHGEAENKRFDFTDWYTDQEAEQNYKELHELYSQLDGSDCGKRFASLNLDNDDTSK